LMLYLWASSAQGWMIMGGVAYFHHALFVTIFVIFWIHVVTCFIRRTLRTMSTKRIFPSRQINV